jgi:hypothetical protein
LRAINVKTTAPNWRARLLVAVGVGAATSIVAFLRITGTFKLTQAADFTQVYVGAQAVLHGADPYSVVAGRTDLWSPLLFYPLPALLIVMPLVWLPMKLAATIFLSLGSTWLAYAVTRDGWWRLWMFASAGFWWSIVSVQWTPLLMAGALAGASAGLAIAAKPTMALPLLAMQTTRRAVIWGLVFGAAIVAVSLMVQPHWPIAWFHTVRDSPVHDEYVSPAFTLLGLPVWLAVLRWRDWRARLLLGMAITPLNAFSYAHFPLLLVARNRLEVAALGLASWIAFFITIPISFRAAAGTPFVALTHRLEPIAILGYYFPALVVVLRYPNVGVAPTAGATHAPPISR